MNKKINISEGYSLNYLVPAVFLFAISIPFLIFIWKIGIIIAFIAFILLRFKTGVVIDIENKRFLSYKSIFGILMGQPKDVSKYHTVYIVFTHDVDEDDLNSLMEAGSMFQAKTYDLFVKNDLGKLHLHEFVNYDLARNALEVIRENFEMNFYDPIEENREKMSQKKR